MRTWKWIVVLGLALAQCKTKSDVRREQEAERLKTEREVQGSRLDSDNLIEDLKLEIIKLNNLVEERAVQTKRQLEQIREENKALESKLQALETKLNTLKSEERTQPSAVKEDDEETTDKRMPVSFEQAKRLFGQGNFSEASEVLSQIIKKVKPAEQKKALYMYAESLFQTKEYAEAAIQFAEFKKRYTKDQLIAFTIYRQALCFKHLGKKKEAQLFAQELTDKFPKTAYAQKIKKELN